MTQKVPCRNILVVADDREVAGGVPSCLREMPRVDLRIERLATGDYVVDRRLCVERKTIQDFAASIRDGRLFEQACRILSGPTRACWILEGCVPLNRERIGGLRREALQGAVVTLTVVLGLPLLRSTGPRETAELMVYAANQIARRLQGGVVRRGFHVPAGRRQRLHLLQGIPGVGADRAHHLLDHFRTVAGVFGASERELRQVKGIGRGLARSIRRLGHGC